MARHPKAPGRPPPVNPAWRTALEEGDVETAEILKRAGERPVDVRADTEGKKSFPDRSPPRLSDDEIVRLVGHLPKPRRMSDASIAGEINHLAAVYRRDRERECKEKAHPPSRVREDLRQGLGLIRRALDVLDPLGARGPDLGRALTWIDRLLKWLMTLNPHTRTALGIDEDEGGLEGLPEIRAPLWALKELRKAGTGADALAVSLAMVELWQLGALVVAAIAEIDCRLGQRRSRALQLLTDGLASLYERATGGRPTYTFSELEAAVVSPFGRFACEVVAIVDPAMQPEANAAAWAAAGRRKHLKVHEEITIVEEVYIDWRDKKRARRGEKARRKATLPGPRRPL